MKKLFSLFLVLFFTGTLYAEITPLPDPPQRTDPANFSAKADAFLGALPAFGTEANALAIEAAGYKDDAAISATAAELSSNTSLASANFAGVWSTLTGTLSVPASTYHNLQYWQLTVDLADVTTAEPGVSASWLLIQSGDLFLQTDTISSLRGLSLIPTDGQIITVLGYYANGDGGGGQFYWDATSTETDNGTTIIKVTSILTGRFIRILNGALSFKMSGAGDGADDTARIQTCIDLHLPIVETSGEYNITTVNIDLYGCDLTLSDEVIINVTGNGFERDIPQVTRATFLASNSTLDGYNYYYTLKITGGKFIVGTGATAISDRLPFIQYIGSIPTPTKTGLQPYQKPMVISKSQIILDHSTATGIGIHGGWGTTIDGCIISGYDEGLGITIGGDGTYNTSSHPQLISILNTDFSSCLPIDTIKGTCTNSCERLVIEGCNFSFVQSCELKNVNLGTWLDNMFVSVDYSVIVTDSGRITMSNSYFQPTFNAAVAADSGIVNVTNSADFKFIDNTYIRNTTATTRFGIKFNTSSSSDFIGVDVSKNKFLHGGTASRVCVDFNSTGAFKFDNVTVKDIQTSGFSELVSFFDCPTDATNVTIENITPAEGETGTYIAGFSNIDTTTSNCDEYFKLLPLEIRSSADNSGVAQSCLKYTLPIKMKTALTPTASTSGFTNVTGANSITVTSNDREGTSISLVQLASLSVGTVVEATATLQIDGLSF